WRARSAGGRPADRARLAEARRAMTAAQRAGELAPPFETARQIADAHPQAAEAQNLAGEIAYRASRWPEAVEYLRRGASEAQGPELRFYLAVALYESGERDEAARVLREVSARLPSTGFVESYRVKILAGEGGQRP
ncbi:MAG TPA: hypothetical protein VHQ65_02340, partial [Thermoanaerobaculia bacterium]|nr:hypothetical protein [Thermoanaerobaculia bacterium]